MRPIDRLVILPLVALLMGCTDTSPAPSSTDPSTSTPGSTTRPPDNTSTSGPTTTRPDRATLLQVRESLEDLFPEEWTPGSHNRAPFTVNACGRTVRIIDADPTDESPNRPQEGFILTTTAPGDINVSVVVYEQFQPDAMEAVEAALPVCGPTTLTNPVDGWILTTDSNGTPATVADLAGFLISSESSRVYTNRRATRYGETHLFFGESNGFVVRVNVSATSTDPTDLEPAADLLALVVAITRAATGG